MEMERVSFTNINMGKLGWSNRDHFMCMKYTINYKEDKNFVDDILSKAKLLEPQVKSTKNYENKMIDIVSAILTEKIALYFYGELAGDDNFFSKEANTSYYQISLSMTDGRKIEVRSSFVYGFPSIPLFKLNKEPNFDGHASYNIPCPNSGYKDEKKKNFYTLVMFPSAKETFLDDIKNEISIYITGTATKNEINNFGGYSNLKSKDIQTKTVNTYYKVVPIHKSLDVWELEELFLEEHEEI